MYNVPVLPQTLQAFALIGMQSPLLGHLPPSGDSQATSGPVALSSRQDVAKVLKGGAKGVRWLGPEIAGLLGDAWSTPTHHRGQPTPCPTLKPLARTP